MCVSVCVSECVCVCVRACVRVLFFVCFMWVSVKMLESCLCEIESSHAMPLSFLAFLTFLT